MDCTQFSCQLWPALVKSWSVQEIWALDIFLISPRACIQYVSLFSASLFFVLNESDLLKITNARRRWCYDGPWLHEIWNLLHYIHRCALFALAGPSSPLAPANEYNLFRLVGEPFVKHSDPGSPWCYTNTETGDTHYTYKTLVICSTQFSVVEVGERERKKLLKKKEKGLQEKKEKEKRNKKRLNKYNHRIVCVNMAWC